MVSKQRVAQTFSLQFLIKLSETPLALCSFLSRTDQWKQVSREFTLGVAQDNEGDYYYYLDRTVLNSKILKYEM